MDDDRGGRGAEQAHAVEAWANLSLASAEVVRTPLWRATDDELVAVLRVEAVAAAQREAARLGVIRELDERGYATGQGAVSTASWLARELLVEPRAAAAQVKAATILDPEGDLPAQPGVLGPDPTGSLVLAATGRALAGGSISRAHADAVATLVRRLPHIGDRAERADLHSRAEQWLLEQCATFDPADVRRLGRQLRHVVDPDGDLRDERADASRDEFWARVCPDTGRVSFRGQTDAVTGAQLITFLDAHSAPRPHTGPDGTTAPDRRTPANRRGHALADLVRLAVDADPAVAGGLGVQLVVTTSLATLQARLGQTGVTCATTETGQPLSAATTRLLACDATLIPVVLGANGEPLDIGRATRAIPLAIRRALVVRDRDCAFPGCRRPPRWADAHHIEHWADGGATSLQNLVLLCGHHHDVIHHTPWKVAIVDGHPVFTPPIAVVGDQAPRGPTPDRAA